MRTEERFNKLENGTLNLIKKTYQYLFIIGMALIPFNSNVPKWLKFLGEYAIDSAPIFFILSFLVLLVYQVINKKAYIPFSSRIYQSFLFFIAILFVVTIINLPQVLDYYFKFTSGPERFIRQMVSLTISGVIFFYLFVNVARDYGALPFFKLIRTTYLICFAVVFTVGILEFAIASLGLGFLMPVYELFNYLPFVDGTPDKRLLRISATTYEPPALGTYLITISGFMFSYILTSKKLIRYIPFLCLVLLAILSKSRTALVVVTFQAVVGVGLAYYMYANFRRLFNVQAIIGLVLITAIVIVKRDVVYDVVEEKIGSLDFTKMNNRTDDNYVSNKTRLGTQIAMWGVFKENPIFGVGWGMQAYEAKKKYPFWAKNRNYEFPQIYLNKHISSFPPSYNLYLRILSEAGIVGFIVFLFFVAMIFYTLFSIYFKNKYLRPLAVALLICFAGIFLNWLQIDTMRVYGFWICLALLIILYKRHKQMVLEIKNKPYLIDDE